MTLTIDVNVLVYAQNRTSEFHEAARRVLESELATGEPVYLFSSVIVAFFRISTQAGVVPRVLEPERVFENVRALLALPHVVFGGPDDSFVDRLQGEVRQSKVAGRVIHDAEIVALMRTHGVDRILTADRDFQRFPGITVTLLERPRSGQSP